MTNPQPTDPSSPLSGLTPFAAASRLASLPGLIFFDSALETTGSQAVSLVAASPSEVIAGQTEADWARLQKRLAEKAATPASNNTGKQPTGFAAGWVEYGGRFTFGFYDSLLLFRHDDGKWIGSPTPEMERALKTRCADRPPAPLPGFHSQIDRETFLQMVARAQEYIAAGDIYQVSLSHRFTAPIPPEFDPQELYRALRVASPAPHAAWLHLEGRQILSSSPELFLEIDGRRIRTRPIKGTRPRHAESNADAQSAQELLASPKERAELVMITDLERNDLGQICQFGSVHVKELLQLEKYEQVFHLVSTVEGELRPEIDPVTALRACFPGGSITGAPKKRAMEIIAELERRKRGLYTGAIGYFGYNGVSQFNIAIRTLVLEGGQAHFDVGAGIVADSIPAMEWQETLDKAAGILRAAQMR